jgi:CBS domain containing-hemolysin-like protein
MKFSIKNSIRWSIFISAVTFALACFFSVISNMILDSAGLIAGMVIVLVIIAIGIFFDVLGLASAAASEHPFHAMASERVNGAKQAIGIVRNADRFSNFCNDVIGDICGVISGGASAMVVLILLTSMNNDNAMVTTIVSVLFAGLVSAMTVGGKAIGKSFAMNYSTEIILAAGKAFYFLERRFGIKVFQLRKNKSNGKRGKHRAS